VQELGCVMYGNKECRHFSLKHNPDGYWELHDYEVESARHEWNSDKHDRVVKVFPMLIRQFEIDKYIVMARDLHDAAKSFQKVLRDEKEMYWAGVLKKFDGTYGEALYGVNANFSSSMTYIHKHRRDYVVVDYDELVKDPIRMVKRIALFLDIGSSNEDMLNAAKLVKRKVIK